MKKTMPSEIPDFKNDEEIAAFMEKYDGYDLVDAGLATIVPAPFFTPEVKASQKLLKEKRIQITFRDEQPLRKMFSSNLSDSIFWVIDSDFSGILVEIKDPPASGNFYIPYLNIGGIKVLDYSK